MNKEVFIEQLSKRITYSKEECLKINDILEDNLKEKIKHPFKSLN